MLCELSTVLSVSVSRGVHYERFYCIRAYVGEFFHEFSRHGQLILYSHVYKEFSQFIFAHDYFILVLIRVFLLQPC